MESRNIIQCWGKKDLRFKDRPSPLAFDTTIKNPDMATDKPYGCRNSMRVSTMCWSQRLLGAISRREPPTPTRQRWNRFPVAAKASQNNILSDPLDQP